jgi:hypothetical protein
MQITARCFDWAEVQKRTSPEQIVEEMIHTDDIDIYAKELPDGIWMSDSATQHFETAEHLVEVDELPYENRPRSADPDFWDVWTLAEERMVDWGAIAQDWSGQSEP